MTTQQSKYFIFDLTIGSEHQYFEADSDLLNTKTKIQSFSEFPNGWCYGEGEAFSDTVINAAIELEEESQEHGLLNTDAFPGPDGDIKFTIYYDDIYHEFTIDHSLTVTYVREEGEVETIPANLTLEEAKFIIQSFAEEIWSSDFSQYTGTTELKMSLKTGHLNHRLIA